MMYRNCCQRLAPSRLAASYRVLSTLIMVPKNRIVFCPVYRHTEVAARATLLMLWSCSQSGHSSSATPNSPRIESRT